MAAPHADERGAPTCQNCRPIGTPSGDRGGDAHDLDDGEDADGGAGAAVVAGDAAAAAEVARTSVQAAIQNVTVRVGMTAAVGRRSASHPICQAARALTAARVERVALDTLRVGTVGCRRSSPCEPPTAQPPVSP